MWRGIISNLLVASAILHLLANGTDVLCQPRKSSFSQSVSTTDTSAQSLPEGFAVFFQAPQSITFKRLNIEDGLSQSTVFAMLQDHEGFMWFATQDGLNRYDGYSFTIFRNNPYDNSSLRNNWILDLYQAASRRLWVISRDGISLYNPINQSFINFASDSSIPSTRRLLSSVITCWHEDTYGTFWIGTDKGLHIYNALSNTVSSLAQHTTADGTLPKTKIFALLQDRSGKLWAATAQGLYWTDCSLAAQRNTPIRWQRVTAPHLQQHCTTLHEDANGTLWVGVAYGSDLTKPEYGLVAYHIRNNTSTLYSHTSILPASQRYKSGITTIKAERSGALWVQMNEGLLRLHPKADNILQSAQVMLHNPKDSASLSSNTVTAIFEDKSGLMWIGTTDGLDLYNHTTKSFVHFRNDPANPYSLSYNVVRSVYQDRSGTLWFGVDAGGINSWHPARQRFALYRQMPFTTNTLSNNSVRTFAENPDGTMWIGTDNGLNLFDRTRQRWQRFTVSSSNSKNGLQSNAIRSLYRDRDGTMWIGTNGMALQRYLPKTGQFEHFPFRPEDSTAFPSDRARVIFQDHTGRIWIGCHVSSGGIANTGGLALYHPETKTFTRFLHNPSDSTSLSNNEVRCLYEDKQQRLWVGTYKGLNIFSPSARSFKRYFHHAYDSTSISSNIICSVHQDKAGRYWVATANGLNEFHPATETFTRYTVREGLPNNFIYGILEDQFGLLWLSTNNGLSRFNPATKTFRNYNIGDGLQSNEFNSGAFLVDSHGDLWFGGINGFNIVTPSQMHDNSHVSPIVLTAFTVFNKPHRFKQPINDFVYRANGKPTHHMVLNYDENLIGLEFVTLDFINSANSEYMYKLDGVDETWVQAGKRHFVSYSQLEPGEYTFRIRASNSDGVWDMEGVALSIVITPPFWQTWWFRLVVALSIVASAGMWHIVRIRAIEARNRLLKRLVDERTAELRHKHDELAAADEEIRRKNAILEEQAAHIELTNTELQEKNEELKILNEQLEDYSEELERNSEILAQQAQEIELVNTELQHKNLELADANIRLEALNQRKNELIGVVAHDLKNPLAAIMMTSSMIERYLDRMGREDLLKQVSNIHSTSNRMNKIILDLLDVEAIESGKFNLTMETLDVVSLAAETLNDYRIHAERKRIRINFEPTAAFYVHADKRALRQILDNLISNAIKYSPTDKNIWVLITREESATMSIYAARQGALIQDAESNRRVQIIVKDEGPGLSAEDQQKLFGRFAKLTPRPTAGEHSTGLGLSIVKQLVEAMNGRVWCESVLGQGAAFIVELPEAEML
jgi:ligand-binding sensor domain-containing protein/signal transduction histidine kinase